jgi:prepilin-type N-terminal cleavage/methylation domain-containing protein
VRARKGSGARSGESGFTLFELIAVIIIVGLVFALAATKLDFLVPKYRLRGAAREVASLMKLGKARAVASGKDVYLEIDLSQGKYWLLVAFPKDRDEAAAPTDRSKPIEPRVFEYQAAFDRQLPEGVEFTDVITSEKDRVDRGRTRIRLLPLGTSGHTIVNLRNQESRELAVKLNGFTGSVTFYEEHKNADQLLQDTGP